jgi:outer membrane protein TolC
VLYDGGARGAQAHLSLAQRREDELRLSQLRDTISDELKTASEQLDTKRSALTTALNAVQLSEETLKLVRVQHDAGTATQLDLLEAQDALVASEVALAQARFDLALADLTLRRAAGTFPGPRIR